MFGLSRFLKVSDLFYFSQCSIRFKKKDDHFTHILYMVENFCLYVCQLRMAVYWSFPSPAIFRHFIPRFLCLTLCTFITHMQCSYHTSFYRSRLTDTLFRRFHNWAWKVLEESQNVYLWTEGKVGSQVDFSSSDKELLPLHNGKWIMYSSMCSCFHVISVRMQSCGHPSPFPVHGCILLDDGGRYRPLSVLYERYLQSTWHACEVFSAWVGRTSSDCDNFPGGKVSRLWKWTTV